MRCRFIAIGLIIFAGCSSTQMTQPADAEKVIAQMNRNFSDAVRRGDAATIVGMYGDDAVFMPPNMPAARGREAIRQAWTGFLSAGHGDLNLMTDNVIQSCDMAAEIGHYDFTLTPNAAGAVPVHDSGKYVVTWRKLNRQWRIVADIFNTNLPR